LFLRAKEPAEVEADVVGMSVKPLEARISFSRGEYQNRSLDFDEVKMQFEDSSGRRSRCKENFERGK